MLTISKILLYGIALGLSVYLFRNIVREKKLTTSDAVALLGTVIALILAISDPSSLPFTNTSRSTPTATATVFVGTEQSEIATATLFVDSEQSAIATATAVASIAHLEFGPSEGNLVKIDQDGVSHNADVNLEDFIVSARFYNPTDKIDGSWSYGFLFRDSGPSYYALVVSSRKDWIIIYSENGQDTTLANKRYQDLDVSPGGHNKISLVMKDTTAIVFINNNYLGNINSPQEVVGGTIVAVAGFYISDEVGVPIHFKDFSIWSLEP